MFETIINLKPESQWRPGMTVEKLKDEMNDALTIPGVANSFTMPIKARTDMLATGIRTPVGIKVLGPKIEEVERIGLEIEHHVKSIPGTRSAYAERVTTGYFLDFDIKREEVARYGLSVEDVQEVIESAVGGMNLTTTIEGRERYPVNVRYARELRGDIERLKRILVPVMAQGGSPAASGMGSGASPQASIPFAQIPLEQLADIKVVKGPTAIKSEQGLLTSYVFVDFSGRDVGGYVEEAKKSVASLKIPEGYRLEWSGEYEYLVKTHERLKMVIPLTLLIIFVLIYFNTRSVTKTVIVLLAVPFSLVGSFWLLYILELQHEHCRLGRYHRPCGTRRGDRGGHAPLSRSCLRSMEKGRKAYKHCRPERCHHAWRRKEDPPQDHDGERHPCRLSSHHVQPWRRGGRHEEDRRANGWRGYHLDHSGADHLSRYLYDLAGQGVWGSWKKPTTRSISEGVPHQSLPNCAFHWIAYSSGELAVLYFCP